MQKAVLDERQRTLDLCRKPKPGNWSKTYMRQVGLQRSREMSSYLSESIMAVHIWS